MLDIQHKPLHNAQNDVLACIDLFAKLVNHNKLPNSPQGFQTLLKDTHHNSTKFRKSIIQRNEHLTHPWMTNKHPINNADIEMMDISPPSKPQPISSTNKYQHSPIVLEDRKLKKLKK